MFPRVIMFNTVSVDGSIKDFELDIGLHYEVADKIKADAHLIGSETAKTGIETFTEQIPIEEQSDFVRPVVKPGDARPYWIISDSKGKLKGLLHVYRRSCYCKDVIVLVTRNTAVEYLSYLSERNYNIISTGEDNIDFRSALDKLSLQYNVKTVLTDSGGGLNSVLLGEGLVSEIGLLISPTIVGKEATNLFRSLTKQVNLELIRSERVRSNHLLILYRVLTNISEYSPSHLGGEPQKQ
jgi:2,5-diamino-6-(ribosylamino)-4(3H)-pyrimidinone 5'-phosphate reductase